MIVNLSEEQWRELQARYQEMEEQCDFCQGRASRVPQGGNRAGAGTVSALRRPGPGRSAGGASASRRSK